MIVNKINTECAKWRQASGVLSDQRVPLQIKGYFHKTTITPDLLY